MMEPLRNHGDHSGVTAIYVVEAPQWHRAFGITRVPVMTNRNRTRVGAWGPKLSIVVERREKHFVGVTGVLDPLSEVKRHLVV